MTLFKGQPPDNQLMIPDERVLRVEDGNDGRGEVRQYPVEIIGRRPTPAHPWRLGRTAGGWDLALVDYAPALEASFEPQAVPGGGAAVPGVGSAGGARAAGLQAAQADDGPVAARRRRRPWGARPRIWRPCRCAAARLRQRKACRSPSRVPAAAAGGHGGRGHRRFRAPAGRAGRPADLPTAAEPSGVKVRLKVDGNGKPTVLPRLAGCDVGLRPVPRNAARTRTSAGRA